MESFLDFITGLGVGGTSFALWGAIALFVLATALIFALGWRSKLMMTKRRRITLLVLRVATLLLFCGALAQLTTTRSESSLSLALVTDVSQSIPAEELARTQKMVEQTWQAKGEIPARLLNFEAKSRESRSDTGSRPDVKRLSTHPGTDIAGALHTAGDLFSKNSFKRAVLFSDGNETRGDALFEAGFAKTSNIQIDVIPLQTSTDRDIYIESINLPQKARPGERIKVSVTVVSNFATTATLTLKRGGAIEAKRKIDVMPGSNKVDFDTTVQSNYSINYSASIDSQEDNHPDNNQLAAMLRVLGNPRIMVYSGGEGGDLPLIDALSANRLSVSAAPVEKFPGSASALNAFDLVILSNIDFLNFGKQRADLLQNFVGKFGGGLLVIGGEKGSVIRHPEDSKKDKREKLPIEEVLPVWLNEKKKTEPNPVALLFVIDKSSSMARENKFGMAMRAAKDSIALLSDRSKVGVLLFDDFPRWAVPMQPAKNRDEIIKELDRFGVDGGTSIYPAMREGYTVLKELPNKVKHVILLSDGISITTFNANAHIIGKMAEKKMTVSTVALGKESDRKHLRQIAQLGKGRFYYTENIEQIPKIFMKETKSITKTNVVETQFVPTVVKKGRLLADIDFKQTPKLYGYNSAKAKPTSEVFMNAEKKEPLIASWRYGLGKVSFVGADSGYTWSRDWPKWDQYATFWSGIAKNTLGDQNRRNYRIETHMEGDQAVVDVDALDPNGNFINDLDLRLEIKGPDQDEPRSVPLEHNRPGGYTGRFDVASFGDYNFQVKASGDGARSAGIGRVFLSPPTEFISQQPDTALLKKIAEITGGRYNPSLAQILEMPKQTYPHTEPIWPYLLWASLALFLVSIIVRRS